MDLLSELRNSTPKVSVFPEDKWFPPWVYEPAILGLDKTYWSGVTIGIVFTTFFSISNHFTAAVLTIGVISLDTWMMTSLELDYDGGDIHYRRHTRSIERGCWQAWIAAGVLLAGAINLYVINDIFGSMLTMLFAGERIHALASF